MVAATGRRQPGFALIEVIVALMVLATAALGVAGMLTWAANQMRVAESDEVVVSVAESALDSLLGLQSPVAGERAAGAGSVRWSVEASQRYLTLRLHLRFADSSRARDLDLRVTRVTPPSVVSEP